MPVLAFLIAISLISCRGSESSGSTSASTTAVAGITTSNPKAESSGAQSLTMGTLRAGVYQTRNFDPTLTFALPDGWHQYFDEEDDEIALGGPQADINMTRPPRVLDPETGAVDAPEDLADWLLNHSQFEVTEAESANVAGIESTVIDVEGPAGTVEFFAYPGGNMRVPEGVAVRFIVVPMAGSDLVLVVLPSGGTLADAISATQSIVNSLAILESP